MSVFNDFQRLWMQRFPQSSLSDAWEQDVRASLDRHKLKIAELTKELEQETLYVEYLERLLSDVENYRESGGDPTTLFEASSTSQRSTQHVEFEHQDSEGEESTTTSLPSRGIEVKSSLNLRETSDDGKTDKNNRLSLNTDNKYENHNILMKNANVEKQNLDREDIKDVGTEKEVCNVQKHGALHQCITELASGHNLTEHSKITSVCAGTNVLSAVKENASSVKENPAVAASHFVTVIEVKEIKANADSVPAVDKERVHPEDQICSTSTSSNVAESSDSATTTFSSFERLSHKVEPSAPPLSSSYSMSSYGSHLDMKKKMPPRPPPKYSKRVDPPTIPGILSSSPKREASYSGMAMPLPLSSTVLAESPSSSLERNIKPSDILRQKSSSDALEAKAFMTNRKTTPDMGKYLNTPEMLEEFGRKMGKSESLEKTKRSEVNATQSPTGSLGRTVSTPNRPITPVRSGGLNAIGISPTGSLNKTAKVSALDSATTAFSLDNKSEHGADADTTNLQGIGSKESLSSQGIISEIIKSYESISSLNSDGTKAHPSMDNEPYYDTVPLDNGDGEYVYVKPGGTGSTSSRDDLSTPNSNLQISAATHASSGTHLNSQLSVTDPESPSRSSNYVNIDYFLHQSNETRSSSLDSDGEYDGPPIMRTISHDEHNTQTPGALRKNLVSAILTSGNVRGAKIRSILSSIINSETIYVECLNKMIQYKRAIHSTLGTSQPVIKEEDENKIFFQIEELYNGHTSFLNDLKLLVAHEGGDVLIGDAFKQLADFFDYYSAFLHNYGQAIETVKKCSANNPQFKKIVSTIVLNLQTEQSLTLEDLLHKPVARVQINALIFNDLLNETPSNHPDHQPLRQAHKKIHMFLKQFNVVNQRLPSESNRNLRRMVKNSFIVELVDGHRKLRHLFLFNDVIACAKYKASGRDRIEYELKWFIPLKDVWLCEGNEAISTDLKESSPANILQLKTQACTVRDQLLLEEKDEKAKKANGLRSGDKYRRKLADLESQLVLASPNLVFRIGNKTTNKTNSFFLSSDFERTQWIDSIKSLKEACNIPGANPINALEVHAFIVAMQKGMKTEMGSYLMRNTNDESLLVGDLHLTVQGLTGLEKPADLYICIEVDSYGHYFRKATTKMICRSTSPLWNESFVLELEGSQNLRILLYEARDTPLLRAKHVLKLSRTWLPETSMSRVIRLGETITLNTALRFVPGEVTLRRVPTSKPGALFGAKMSQVLKREKRDIPFIVSACIREVERRGMSEVGIYRVSGSASDLAKLKKSFETNAYEAEQLLKDVDIHSVTGILKSYLRELPEALFSDFLYPKFFETFSQFSNNNEIARINELLKVFEELSQANKVSINHILDHLIRVHHQEADNKMSLHNLAMVFGPTLLRPGQTQPKQKDILASSTVDVMAQAGILYCFLQARIKKE